MSSNVGLDQSDVVQRGTDAVFAQERSEVNHVVRDALELTQRVAASVLHRGQPPAYLRSVRHRRQREDLALLHPPTIGRRHGIAPESAAVTPQANPLRWVAPYGPTP